MGKDVVQLKVGETVLLVGCSQQGRIGRNLSKARRIMGRHNPG
jgi:hypothetical protein